MLPHIASLARRKGIKIACPNCMISWLRHKQLNLWSAAAGCGMRTTIKGSPYLEIIGMLYILLGGKSMSVIIKLFVESSIISLSLSSFVSAVVSKWYCVVLTSLIGELDDVTH